MAERGGLPWYQIWTEFSRHGKTRDLCGRVKDRNAGMYVIRLWEHCADYALDGRIPAHVVEEAADWRGRPGQLLAALEATGEIEVAGEDRIVHGWEERNGARIRQWQRDLAKRRGQGEEPFQEPEGPQAATPSTPTRKPRQNPSGSPRGVPGKPLGIDGRSETSRGKKAAAAEREAHGEQPKLGPEAAEAVTPPTAEAAPEPTSKPAAPDPGPEQHPGASPATPDPSLGVRSEAAGAESSGPEEDTGPANEDAVEANAASGMERPAARDGGEADLVGMARGQGAAGPARRGPVVDEIERPAPVVYDLTEGLGPLGAEFKARLEVELHRGLSGPAAERRAAVATELEQLLEVHGVDRAVGLVVATCQGREGSGAPCTASISGMTLILRSLPPPRPDLLDAVRRYCPEWALVLEALQRLPPGDQLQPGVLETLFLTLEASFKRGQLVLVAKEPWQASAIEDLYLRGLRKIAVEVLGAHVGVDLKLAEQAPAAGRA